MDWGKKRDEETAGPESDSKPAAPIPALGDADPATALAELAARLDADAGTTDAKARIEALARVQDAGAAHVASLLAQYLAGAAGTYAAREVVWKSLVNYQSSLTQALCSAAGAALTVLSAARALRAIRMLAKLHLVHYAGVPGKLWHVAYAIHAGAERAGFAATPVHVRADEHTTTTIEQELLRLLMLRVSTPDMMAPEQIEIADRVVEELGAEFTLRPPGVADNPFCFEPESEYAPRRAKGRPPSATARYFGPGMGHDSLKRIARQLTAAGRDGFKAYGKDFAPSVQQGAVQHLLLFWRADCPYSPPGHESAAGTLQVVHGYDALWQYLSQAHQGAALSLAEWSPAAAQPPDAWPLRGEGGNELGVEVPAAGRAWAKCGAVVGASPREGERWAAMIRRMHALPDGGLHADLALLSRAPRALALREVVEMGDDSAFTNASSRQFAVSGVNAVILADGSGDGAQPANLLLPAGRWKEGRVYEIAEEPPRQLRCLQAVRHGDDYVRATFEWLAAPDALAQR